MVFFAPSAASPAALVRWQVLGVLLYFLLFFLAYQNQFRYLFFALSHRAPRFPAPQVFPRVAVLIPARNEERVIVGLVSSLLSQDYPKDRFRVFVMADNCTDGTERAAREAGAEVFVREDLTKIGKGYALDALLSEIGKAYGEDAFDAFAVFDADNLAKPNFLTEAAAVLVRGYRVVTTFRNTRNFRGFPATGYAIWFWRDSHLMNGARMLSGIGANVSGTGYLFTNGFRKEIGGFPFHLLCEDLELTCYCALSHEKIGYADRAEFYDEQPESYRDSVRQRVRWVKGGAQVFSRYGRRLFAEGFLRADKTARDLFLSIFPAAVLSVGAAFFHLVFIAVGIFKYHSFLPLWIFLGFLFLLWFVLFCNGVLTVRSVRKRIPASRKEIEKSLFSFPFFLLGFFPIVVRALFSKSDWKQIRHRGSVSLADLST